MRRGEAKIDVDGGANSLSCYYNIDLNRKYSACSQISIYYENVLLSGPMLQSEPSVALPFL
jgi:hypothetical protein